ncbi:glycine zipper 2TM domain-containing protein [Burkholderia alba]|uniref:glycine zipper 2TM domain-containing protein n=1 Tax=Burkholderia alba TaxID=2683677 RepID=UPI002B060FD6|nr:glycine zipper 2TM domain-containing protein [Burkholderia alba]
MDDQNTTPKRQRLHPLIATAAGAVIVASLAATAAVTGLFPKANGTDAQPPQTLASQPAVDTAAAASAALAAQAQQQAAQQQQQQLQQQQAAAQPAPKPAPKVVHRRPAAPPQPPQYTQQPYQPQQAYCQSCGTVVAIDPIRTAGQSTGLGAIGGAAAGGFLGNQFGHGNGRAAMTVLGALGGGLAGNSVEKQVRSETDYQVRVQMENGSTRTFTYRSAPPFGQGQRVRIENGSLVAA